MAELTPKERLLPSLLDRLTDNRPSQLDESRDDRIGSEQSLRQSVLRDLEWLMNTVNLESVIDFESYPELSATVLNYGLPGVAGTSLEGRDFAEIEKLIKRAIQAFEPRILKNSLRVRLIPNAELENRSAVAFQIEGMLWGRQMPEALFLHTELDLELGDVKIKEL
ncbi:MAG: type VI secretion system baseplate subunit TssE [Granulosicoccus sp.]